SPSGSARRADHVAMHALGSLSLPRDQELGQSSPSAPSPSVSAQDEALGATDTDGDGAEGERNPSGRTRPTSTTWPQHWLRLAELNLASAGHGFALLPNPAIASVPTRKWPSEVAPLGRTGVAPCRRSLTPCTSGSGGWRTTPSSRRPSYTETPPTWIAHVGRALLSTDVVPSREGCAGVQLVEADRWPGAVVDLGRSLLFSGSRRALVAAEQSTETFRLDDFTSAIAVI